MPLRLRISVVLAAALLLDQAHCRAEDPPTSPPNILLLLVDDLKPALGCYGDPYAKTPHLDQLAARGLRFDLAYCNQAVCAPSRFTLMLGAHSTATGLYGLGHKLRRSMPEAVTMPQFFAKHGYYTESMGKIFHIGHGNEGDPESFSVPHFHDKVIEYLDPASTGGGSSPGRRPTSPTRSSTGFALSREVPHLKQQTLAMKTMRMEELQPRPSSGYGRPRPGRVHFSWPSVLSAHTSHSAPHRNTGTFTTGPSSPFPPFQTILRALR